MLTIIKLDLNGSELFRWTGQLVAQTPQQTTIRAIFDRYDRLDLGYTVFERGDVFIEHFYTDRYYSVFAIHGVGGFKGWYCNINRPAEIDPREIRTVDLALDVWIYPDTTSLVLDEDDFAALPLQPAERAVCWAAVIELQTLAIQHQSPFDPASQRLI